MEGNIIDWYASSNDHVTAEGLDDYLQFFLEVLDLCEKPVSIETGRYPVILHPMSFYFLLETLQIGLNGRSVFEGISPLKDRIGEKVLSEKLTLMDDPTWEKGDHFTTFDHEGVPAQKKAIFDRGVLKSYMTNLEYAARLGIEPTGHGYRRSFLEDNIHVGNPGMLASSRIIEPGDVSYPDMLSGISEGLLLVMSFDCWQGTLYNGDFSGSVSMGFKIQDGKLTGRVKDTQISGNIYKMLGDQLESISEERIQPGSSSDLFPYILVKDMVIS
jgi:PmbA protein